MVNTTRSNCPRILIRSYSSLLGQMLNRGCLYMNLSRANNNSVSIHIHRVNSTCRRRFRILQEISSPIITSTISVAAVNGGFAIVAASKTQSFGISIPIAKSSPTAVRIVLNRNSRHVLSAVALAIQIMAEPFVQNTVIRLSINQQRNLRRVIVRSDMCALMEQQLNILACILKRIIHQLELLSANVRIVQTMNNQRRAAKVVIGQTVIGLLALVACSIVTGCPVRAVVTIQRNLIIVNTVEICRVNILDGVPFRIIRIHTSVDIASCTHERQMITICYTAGGNTLRIGVLVPACNACNRNDGLKALNTGGSDCEVSRAAVGTAGHSDIAVRPVGFNCNIAGSVGISSTVTGQPLDNALECVGLNVSAASLQALRAERAQTAYLNRCIAANEEVVVPVKVLVVVEGAPCAFIRAKVIPLFCRCFLSSVHGICRAFSLACSRLHIQIVQVIALIAIGIIDAASLAVIRAAGDVRTCIIDGRSLVLALCGSTGKLHQRLYEIELAIAVGVVVGLNVNRVADDVALIVAVAVLGRNAACVRENRLCNAVYEQRSAVLYCIAQVNSCCAVCHRVQLFQRAGCGTVELVICDAYALRHSDVVAVAARELRFLHAAIQQNVLDRIQLGQAAALCRSFERRIGRYLLSVIAAVCINSARLTGERQDHGKHQREAGRSLLHVYSLFRGKYRISAPVFIIQRWIFYRSFEF